MSLVPPPPVNSGANAVSIAGFPSALSPFPNVQPFSYPDGVTFQKLFERYRTWLLDDLVPHIDAQGNSQAAAYNAASLALSEAMSNYLGEIAQDRSAFETMVNSTFASMTNAINAKVTAAQAAQNNAESARDEARTYSASTVTLQTSAVNAIIANVANPVRTALDLLTSDFPGPRPVANSYPVEDVRFSTKGANAADFTLPYQQSLGTSFQFADGAYPVEPASVNTPMRITNFAATGPYGSNGDLPAGTYYAVVTAITGDGETIASNEISWTTTATGQAMNATFTAPVGSSPVLAYNVYVGTVTRDWRYLSVSKLGGSATVAVIKNLGANVGLPPLTGPMQSNSLNGNIKNWFYGGGTPIVNSWLGNPSITPSVAGTTTTDIGSFQNSVRFRTDAKWVIIRMHAASSGTWDGVVQIKVNGVPLWDVPKDFGGVYGGSAGALYIQFRDKVIKNVEVFHSTRHWLTITWENNAVMGPYPAPVNRKRVVLVGDSWTAGTTQAGPIGSFAKVAQLGSDWETAYNGRGGTGYVSGDRAYTDAVRVASYTESKPDLIVIIGSINDTGKAGIANAATNLMATIKTASPNTKIILIGAQFSSSADVTAALKTVADANVSGNIIGLIDPVAEGWTTVGVVGPTDNIHPSPAGAEYWGYRVNKAIRKVASSAGLIGW